MVRHRWSEMWSSPPHACDDTTLYMLLRTRFWFSRSGFGPRVSVVHPAVFSRGAVGLSSSIATPGKPPRPGRDVLLFPPLSSSQLVSVAAFYVGPLACSSVVAKPGTLCRFVVFCRPPPPSSCCEDPRHLLLSSHEREETICFPAPCQKTRRQDCYGEWR